MRRSHRAISQTGGEKSLRQKEVYRSDIMPEELKKDRGAMIHNAKQNKTKKNN
jgi:hypothetical protein